MSLKLDEEERIIIYFKKMLNLDVTMIEIIPKIKIWFLFFNPQFDSEIMIQTVQFPFGNTLSINKGNILGIDCYNKYYFYINIST